MRFFSATLLLSSLLLPLATLASMGATVDPVAEGYEHCFEMFNAGEQDSTKSNYIESSTAYCKKDCTTDYYCIYVVAKDGYHLSTNVADSWFKDYSVGNSVIPAVDGIQFIQNEGGHTVAWQGCFDIPATATGVSVEIHANFGELGKDAGSTTSTGKRAGNKAGDTVSITYPASCSGDVTTNNEDTPVDTPVDAPVDTPVDTPVDAPVDEVVEVPRFEGYDFCYQMYNAGEPDSTKANYIESSKAYCKKDCDSGLYCFYVVAEEGYHLATNEAWFKDYGHANSAIPAVGGIFFVQDDAGNTVSWQGCFDIPFDADGSSIELHSNFGPIGGGTGSTSSTGKRQGQNPGDTVSIDYDTCPPAVDPECIDVCRAEHVTCMEKPDECCDGLGCFGFNFYKSCQKPPSCLKEWYDCSSGMACCDDLVCALLDNGDQECQVQTITTRTIDMPPTDPPVDPPNPPPPTELCEGGESLMIAGVYGDPHMHTFDGLGQDCQAEGEFTMAKSTVTGRRIDGRFAHFTDRFSAGWAWAVVKGVAVRDEGPDSPVVEISLPLRDTTFSPSVIGSEQCKVLFYVNGQLQDIATGTGRDDVIIENDGTTVLIIYPKTGLKVQVRTAWAMGCYFNVFGFVPKCEDDSTIGLWGNGDGDTTNDWTTADGELLPVPSDMTARLRHEGYAYCVDHWCVRDQVDSIFTHKEVGTAWEEDIMHCNLPYGSTIEEFLDAVHPSILEFCGDNLNCIIDAQLLGIEGAKATRNDAGVLGETCNGIGGECDVSSCCNGLQCVAVNGFAKECAAELPACVGQWSNCGELQPCCGDLTCTDMNGGAKQCHDLPDCMPEWRSCKDVDCCDGLTCVESSNGQKQCRNLPTCTPEWQPCGSAGLMDCCDGLTCYESPHNGLKTCRDLPSCEHREWLPCGDQLPCCEGMTCVTESNGMDVCRELPSCATEWHDCRFVDCCGDGPKPLECVSVSDAHGSAATCQAACIGDWQETCGAAKPCCNTEEFSCQEGKCKPKPTCSGAWHDCSNGMGCCDDAYTCQSHAGGAQQVCKPKCAGNWQDCSTNGGCCSTDGWTCQAHGTDQQVCKVDLTSRCSADWHACHPDGGCCSDTWACQVNGDGNYQCLVDATKVCAADWHGCNDQGGCCSDTWSCQVNGDGNKQCLQDMSKVCAGDWHGCHPDGGCCSDGWTCQVNDDGDHQCLIDMSQQCAQNWHGCHPDGGCCDSTWSCQVNNDGDHQCLIDMSKQCAQNWHGCHPDGGCCTDTWSCQVNGDGNYQCLVDPTKVCAGNWHGCNDQGGCCTDGWACQTNANGDKQCLVDLASSCQSNWHSCHPDGGCCSDGWTCQENSPGNYQCKQDLSSQCANNWAQCTEAGGCCSDTWSCQNGQCREDLTARCSSNWHACHPDGGCCNHQFSCLENSPGNYQCKR